MTGCAAARVSRLPPTFHWGVATSGFQSEGFFPDSNWTRYAARHEPYRQSVDFYHRFPDDLALAQAVLETGHFTNRDTSINNFAGIAHYDNAASGSAFADPVIGVRAHIQLLKKYAAGNDTALANPECLAAYRNLPELSR